MIQTGIDPNCALASFLIEEIRLSRGEINEKNILIKHLLMSG